MIRTNYSNPPTHGGQIVAAVLTTPELRALWEEELGRMRDRINTMRRQLVENMRAMRRGLRLQLRHRAARHVLLLGPDAQQVGRLREEFSIYAIDSGRICVAALNSRNIDYVARAIASVLV